MRENNNRVYRVGIARYNANMISVGTEAMMVPLSGLWLCMRIRQRIIGGDERQVARIKDILMNKNVVIN